MLLSLHLFSCSSCLGLFLWSPNYPRCISWWCRTFRSFPLICTMYSLLTLNHNSKNFIFKVVYCCTTLYTFWGVVKFTMIFKSRMGLKENHMKCINAGYGTKKKLFLSGNSQVLNTSKYLAMLSSFDHPLCSTLLYHLSSTKHQWLNTTISYNIFIFELLQTVHTIY